MADTRRIKLVRILVNGLPVMAALEGFTPPTVEKSTEDSKGGLFVGFKEVVGVDLGDWTANLKTTSSDLIKSMGEGDQVEITVLTSVEDDAGVKTPIKHEMSGEVLKADVGEIKPGVESMTLMGSPYAYTLTENGSVVHDINAKTQKCVVGGKDLLQEARKHVDLS